MDSALGPLKCNSCGHTSWAYFPVVSGLPLDHFECAACHEFEARMDGVTVVFPSCLKSGTLESAVEAELEILMADLEEKAYKRITES